ncbi:MAG: ABC transporter permease subunit [Planctomycetota bacterium]|nr:ABC transporter permease subunit [Planctomycetota bacterium]
MNKSSDVISRRFPRGQSATWALALMLYLFFGLFLIWPIWRVTAAGVTAKDGGFTVAYLRLIFQDPVLIRGLVNATLIAISVTFLCLLVALPLGILSVRFDFPGKQLLSGLLLAPLVLPPFVGAIGMRLILGRLGPLSVMMGWGRGAGFDWLGRFRLIGILVVETLHLYPVLLLNLQASLAAIDPFLEQAAANLGAGKWTVFRRITLPLVRPGLFAGCTLTLIWSFTELGTPLMFDFGTITPVQIYRQVTDVAANPLPYALVIVTLLASAALYLIGKVALGRGYDIATTKAASSWAPQPLRGWRAVAAAAPFVVVLLLAISPHVSVVLTSFTATGQWYRSVLPQSFTLSHYGAALMDDLAMPSVWNSVRYATCATAVAVAVGLAAAIVIVRGEIRGRAVIDALSMLPLAVPGLALAFGYLAISVGLKQKYGASLPRQLDVQEAPTLFLIVAYAARRLPYVVRSAVAGLQQTPRDLELAGQNLGASRATVLAKITIPLIAANLLAGALLAFAFSLLEVSDSIILAQKAAYFPITRAILELAHRLGDGLYVASALGVWAMLLLSLTLLGANSLLGRRLGAVFRT